MKQQSGSKRLSTFARYVVSYMLVLLLALSALFLYMYVYMNREVRAQVISNGINRLSRIAYQHEGYLDNMLNTAEQIGLSPYLQPFSYRDEPWRAYELMQQLVPYTVSNDFSDQMYLCFASDDYLYSSSSMMTLDMFSSLMHYEHVSGAELMRLIRQPGGLCVLPAQKVASSLLGSDQYDMTTFIIPLGMSQKSERGSMLFLLRQNTYQQLFFDAIAMNANTCILHDGAILASSGELPLSAEELTSLLAGNEATMQREFVSGGVPYTLLALGKRSWGMQYVMLMPSSELTGNVWHSMGGVLMMIAALAVAGSVLSYLLARRNIRPIREISSLLPQDENRGDEWSSIQTGIQELSRRNSDLARRLESSLPMQRHDFVLRFMKGRFDSRELAVAAAMSVRLDIDKPYYGMVLCPEQEQNDQPFTMQEEPLNRVTGVTVCSVEMAAMNNFLYVVFADTEQGLHDVANALHQICIERYGHACVAMSNAHQNFTHAPACYLEAATAYDNRFVMDDSRVLEYSFVSVNLRDILPQARKITDGINQALVLNNRALLSGKLDELLAFLKHSSMTPFAFRLIYNDVIHTLLREHAANVADSSDMKDMYDIFSLSGCQSVDDLDELLRRLCDAILQAEKPVPTEETGGIEEVAAYIREHYADPELSISAIAEAFGVSTARLSLSFKERNRVSPNEYLAILRVERSKQLLTETELSIKEIAVNVGYYDASSFIRRFKQITGVTPLQYRRSKEDTNHGNDA